MSCYSIGQSKRSTEFKQGAFVPGPGAYDPPTQFKITPPAWKIGQATRDGLYARSGNPGPGSYEMPDRITKEGPKHTFGLKTAYNSQKGTAPGPGAYDPSNIMQPTPPKFSLSSRTYIKDGRLAAPGPGAYEYKSSLAVPSSKIGTSKRNELYGRAEAPGPGAYETLRPSSAGPKYGFGSSNRDGSAYEAMRASPGPGSYESKPAIALNKGVTMISRKPDSSLREAVKIPGPGSYDPDMRNKKNLGNVRIGSASRENLNKEMIKTPGPGAYDARVDGVKHKEPAVRMGTSLRRPLSANNAAPGPGAYEIQSRVFEGPKFGLHGSKEDPYKRMKDLAVPGPGSYTLDTNAIYERGATPQIGTGARGDIYKGPKNPGPGMYDVRGTLAGPKWGFGSSQRDNMRRGMEPGPGAYNLPPKFGDVPKYLLPNGPKYKY